MLSALLRDPVPRLLNLNLDRGFFGRGVAEVGAADEEEPQHQDTKAEDDGFAPGDGFLIGHAGFDTALPPVQLCFSASTPAK